MARDTEIDNDCSSETGWFEDNGTVAVISDASAPLSPPDVIEETVPSGMAGGVGACMLENGFGTGRRCVHATLAWWWSEFYEGHFTSKNKLVQFWSVFGAGANRIIFEPYCVGSGTITPGIALQSTGDGGAQDGDNPGSIDVARIAYVHAKIWVKNNTLGNSDGEIWVWINGELALHLTALKIVPDGAANANNDLVQVGTVWGGTTDTVPADQFVRYDQIFVEVADTTAEFTDPYPYIPEALLLLAPAGLTDVSDIHDL